MNIGGIEVGGNAPVRVIAEMSNNHNGSLANAHRIIDKAKEAGADFLKTQAFVPSELVALRGDGPAPEPWGSQGWTVGDLYAKAATPFAWLPEIKKHCENVGIVWFSSFFGEESLALLASLDCPAFKIAAIDVERQRLWRMVEATGKPVVASFRDLGHLYRVPFRPVPIPPAAMLFCPPSYPQTSFGFRGVFQQDDYHTGFDGFSYHGTDFQVPAYAVAAGARIIECHVMLYEAPSELESNVSLTDRQLIAAIREIRKVEGLL